MDHVDKEPMHPAYGGGVLAPCMRRRHGWNGVLPRKRVFRQLLEIGNRLSMGLEVDAGFPGLRAKVLRLQLVSGFVIDEVRLALAEFAGYVSALANRRMVTGGA